LNSVPPTAFVPFLLRRLFTAALSAALSDRINDVDETILTDGVLALIVWVVPPWPVTVNIAASISGLGFAPGALPSKFRPVTVSWPVRASYVADVMVGSGRLLTVRGTAEVNQLEDFTLF